MEKRLFFSIWRRYIIPLYGIEQNREKYLKTEERFLVLRMGTLEITTQIGCGNMCEYCPQNDFVKKYFQRSNVRVMSFEVFKKCVDKVPPTTDICFSGMAEPFMAKDCVKMMMYAHEKKHALMVNTTLVGLNYLDIDLLERIPYKIFAVHLPSSGNYEKILIDDQYIQILERISRGSIDIKFSVKRLCKETVHPRLAPLIKKEIIYGGIYARAGNLNLGWIPLPRRRRGRIGCKRNPIWNVLLPNGDVVLCCNDFSLKHILGNLLACDYESLFLSEEFRKVFAGLTDESLDVLCRYCEVYACNLDFRARWHNDYLPMLLKNPAKLVRRVVLRLKELIVGQRSL